MAQTSGGAAQRVERRRQVVRATGAWQQFWKILRVTLVVDLVILELISFLAILAMTRFEDQHEASVRVVALALRATQLITPSDGWNLILVLASFIVALAVAILGVTSSENQLVRSGLKQLRTLAQLTAFAAINMFAAVALQLGSNPGFALAAGVAALMIIAFASVAASRTLQEDTRASLKKQCEEALANAQLLPREATAILTDRNGGRRALTDLPFLRYLAVYLGWHALVVSLAGLVFLVVANFPFGSVHWTDALIARTVTIAGDLFIAWLFIAGLATLAAEGIAWLPVERKRSRFGAAVGALVIYVGAIAMLVYWSVALSAEPVLAVIGCAPIVISMIIPVSPLIMRSVGSRRYWTPRGASRFTRAAYRLRKARKAARQIEEQDKLFAELGDGEPERPPVGAAPSDASVQRRAVASGKWIRAIRTMFRRARLSSGLASTDSVPCPGCADRDRCRRRRSRPRRRDAALGSTKQK